MRIACIDRSEPATKALRRNISAAFSKSYAFHRNLALTKALVTLSTRESLFDNTADSFNLVVIGPSYGTKAAYKLALQIKKHRPSSQVIVFLKSDECRPEHAKRIQRHCAGILFDSASLLDLSNRLSRIEIKLHRANCTALLQQRFSGVTQAAIHNPHAAPTRASRRSSVRPLSNKREKDVRAKMLFDVLRKPLRSRVSMLNTKMRGNFTPAGFRASQSENSGRHA